MVERQMLEDRFMTTGVCGVKRGADYIREYDPTDVQWRYVLAVGS